MTAGSGRNFITVSLQFPHHGRTAIRCRLYELEPGTFRVMVGEAWATRRGVGLDHAMRIVERQLQHALGLARKSACPDLEPGKVVQVVNEYTRPGADGCVESVLWRVVTPCFLDSIEGWCVFVVRSGGRKLRKVKCEDLRDARGLKLGE